MSKALRKGLMTVQKGKGIALNSKHSLTVRKMESYKEMECKLIHKVYCLSNQQVKVKIYSNRNELVSVMLFKGPH